MKMLGVGVKTHPASHSWEETMIPLFKVSMSNEAGKIVGDVLSSGYIGQGAKVNEFEDLLEKSLGKKVVTTNSCTSALDMAYHMTDCGSGEVITSPMTCLATNMPLLHIGAKIVWADVDKDTGNISVDDVRRKINGRTRAVVITHYGGNLCDDRIVDLCKEHNVPLIEDCAHLLHKGFGDYQCYSFQAIKHLTTGDGGALVTGNYDIYRRAKLLRWYGINRDGGSDMRCLEPLSEAGFKYHMNDINASIGIANMQIVYDRHEKTLDNANTMNWVLDGLNSVKLIKTKHRNDYWLYIVLVDDQNKFSEHMKKFGVATSMVHARNDVHPIFDKFKCDLPGLDEFWAKQICIPCGWWLNSNDFMVENDRDIVIKTVLKYEHGGLND